MADESKKEDDLTFPPGQVQFHLSAYASVRLVKAVARELDVDVDEIQAQQMNDAVEAVQNIVRREADRVLKGAIRPAGIIDPDELAKRLGATLVQEVSGPLHGLHVFQQRRAEARKERQKQETSGAAVGEDREPTHHLIFIIHGEDFRVPVYKWECIGEVRVRALKKSHNLGHRQGNWEIRNEKDQALNPVKQATDFANNTRLFLILSQG